MAVSLDMVGKRGKGDVTDRGKKSSGSLPAMNADGPGLKGGIKLSGIALGGFAFLGLRRLGVSARFAQATKGGSLDFLHAREVAPALEGGR